MGIQVPEYTDFDLLVKAQGLLLSDSTHSALGKALPFALSLDCSTLSC